jgi:signal transduction histidine kinase
MTGGLPLRTRLLLLGAAGVLPLAVMAGIALLALFEQRREQAQRAGIEVTRALGTAVDAELRRSIAVLEAIALGPALDRGDVRRYHETLTRILQTRPDWVTITLSDASGKPLANARRPFGEALPPLVDPASFEALLKSRMPAIGVLTSGPRGELGIPVRVPVLRGGELRYVLTAALRPEAFVEVLNRQRLPADWVISIFDAKGQRVARSRQHAEFLGKPAAPSLQALMPAGSEEGAGITRALEGDEIYTAYARSRASGWSVAIGVPPAVVEAGARASLAAYGGGIALSIALGILAALMVARGIVSPMAALRAAAQALGRREPVVTPRTSVAEVDEVGSALAAAAEQQQRHEVEREDLLRREREARGAAENANRAKDEFLAMLGHELRNPLGAISNAARLLEHPRTDAESAQRAREIISRQSDHLARLTDDLLDAGRAVMGKISLQRRPLDLAALVSRALSTLRAAGRTANHRLVQDLHQVWVDGDPIRIEQILSNLVINAAKYTLLPGTIRVTVRKENGEAVLRVRDDGIGMSEDLASRAFDLFVQGERSLDRTLGGLGIGLTLVRRLAEMHGGSASARSDGKDKGSELTVRLPAIEPPAPVPARAPRASPSLSRSILVIEDNDDARESLCRLLEFTGHRVSSAADGAAGLTAALLAKPEVILVDVGLPKMDGYEVAQRIRVTSGDWRPFLVALTGYGLPEDRSRALEAGFDAHLVKPVDHAALEELLSAPR